MSNGVGKYDKYGSVGSPNREQAILADIDDRLGQPEVVAVYQVDIPINNEEFKACPTTAIKLINKQGDGTLIIVERLLFYNTTNLLGGYGNMTTNTSLQAVYGIGWIDDASLSKTNFGICVLQDSGPSALVLHGIPSGFNLNENVLNQDVYLYLNNSGGNLTGGDPSNKFGVNISYSIVRFS